MLGLPREAIEALEERNKVEIAFPIFEENWPSFRAFLSVATQWNIVARPEGGAYWQGLDYAGVDIGLRNSGIAVDPALWGDLRVIEAAARNRLNGVMESD